MTFIYGKKDLKLFQDIKKEILRLKNLNENKKNELINRIEMRLKENEK